MKILFVTNLCEKVSGFHKISEVALMDCSAHGLDYPLNLLKELSKYASIDVFSPSLKGFATTQPSDKTPKFIKFTPSTIAIPNKVDGATFNKDYDVVLIYAESMFSYIENFSNIKPKKVMWFLSSPQQALLPEYDNLSVELVLKVADRAGLTEFSDAFRRLGLKTQWLPLSVDTNRFRKLNLPKISEAGLLGNLNPYVYPVRVKALEYLLAHNIPMFLNPVYGETYVTAINQSRIFVTCSGIWKYAVMKYFEVPACGTLLMADEPMDVDDLGFIAGKNYVKYNVENFPEMFQHYATHVSEAEEVARQGMELVRSHHSDEIRAKELFRMLEKI